MKSSMQNKIIKYEPKEHQCFEYTYERALIRSNSANDCSFRTCALFTVAILSVEVLVVILVVLFSDDSVKVPLNQRYFDNNFQKYIDEFPDNMTMQEFVLQYDNICETAKHVNICPCVSPYLKGPINLTNPDPGEPVGTGGSWKPKICEPRQKIAVIVPFLDRDAHLKIFLSILHPMLQRQLLDYTIFVVEQSSPERFNKAAIMNAGFLEVNKLGNFDCIIFHDVDMLPEDDRNFYACTKNFRHVGSHLSKWNYTIPYRAIFGGAISMPPKLFLQCNGYSNDFWGWGGEDDDMFKRVIAQQLRIVRFPRTASSYQMIKHERDKRNPPFQFAYLANRWRPIRYKQEGLNTVKYQVDKIEDRPLYTWIMMKILNAQIGVYP